MRLEIPEPGLAAEKFDIPYSFYPPLTGSGGTAIGFHSAWTSYFAMYGGIWAGGYRRRYGK